MTLTPAEIEAAVTWLVTVYFTVILGALGNYVNDCSYVNNVQQPGHHCNFSRYWEEECG